MQLVDLVGKREALKIVASSRKILPAQALNIGFVDEVIPEDTVSWSNYRFSLGHEVFF